VESGFLRSPALKLGILSGGGGGVVLRPSLLSAGAKDKDVNEEPKRNGGTNAIPSSTVDPETEEPNGVEAPEEEELEKVNGDGSSTSSSESSSSGAVDDATNIVKESDNPTRVETAVDIESAPKVDLETNAEEQVQKSLSLPEAPKSNGTSAPTFIFGSNLGERVEVSGTHINHASMYFITRIQQSSFVNVVMLVKCLRYIQ